MRSRGWSAGFVAAAVLGAVVCGDGRLAAGAPGAVDPGFGASGVVQTDVGLRDAQTDLLVQPDGKTVSIGVSDGTGFVLRRSAAGALDPSFGSGGIVRDAATATLNEGVLQPDGKVVAVGSDATFSDFAVVRYLPTGAPDGTFGTLGRVQTDFGTAGDDAFAVALQPDGKIVAAGRSGNNVAIARYLANGTPDPTFGTGGRTTTSFGPAGTAAEAAAVGILSTGALVVGGRTVSPAGEPSMLLARYTSGGILDVTHGPGGQVSPANRRLVNVTSLTVQLLDLVVVAGARALGGPQPALARYLPTGTLDPTFGVFGSTVMPVATTGTIEDLAVDATGGRLVAVGAAVNAVGGAEAGFNHVLVLRVSGNGVPDASFGCGGATQLDVFNELGARGAGVALAPDRRILVGGTTFTGPTLTLPARSDLLLARILGAPSTNAGYWITRSDGGVSAFGRAGGCGTLRGFPLNRPIVGHAGRPSGDGYWLVASDGGIFAFGDALFTGSTGGIPLNRPVVGMAATPSGAGYWLVASDGGVFAFGDAGFFGSTGGIPLNRPVVGMAATGSGGGYWLTGADGGVFAFGDAPFLGSTGGQPFARAAVAITSAALRSVSRGL